MSLSLANVALIRSAAQIATGVAGRVGQAIGFDEVLHRQPTEKSGSDEVKSPTSETELRQGLTDAVRQELAKRGVELNQTLELRVDSGGSLQVESNHPQAAEIEAILHSDPTIRQLASELSAIAGTASISIDLTNSGVTGNMFGPGGYPNW